MTGAEERPRILGLLAAAEFMLVLDVSIVNVALPSIRADLGLDASALQWVVDGYAVTFGGFLLLGGRAADLLGGRRTFLWALAAFSGASLACGLAAGPVALAVARALQGLSAGVLSPATLALLTTAYREPAERNRALAAWTAVAIGGGAVGGVLGGLLTGALSWRWIFIVNVPVGTLLLALGARRLPRPTGAGRPRSLDAAGAVTATAGLGTLVWVFIRAGATGWGATEVVAGLAAAVALLGAFVFIEARIAREPLMPLLLLRSRTLAAGNVLGLLSFVPVLPTWFLLTLYLQAVRGCTPVQAGLAFLPMSLAVIGGSQLGFRIRADPRALVAAGGLLAAAGLAWLAQLSPTTGLAWVIAPASLTMTGGGLLFAPVTVAATAGVPVEYAGLASGLLNATRQIGGAVGLAVIGAVAAAHGAPATGYAPALTLGAAVFVVVAAAGAIALPGRRGRARAQPRRARAFGRVSRAG
jgi:EmrB/QacA subfamily drug resistance transporter